MSEFWRGVIPARIYFEPDPRNWRRGPESNRRIEVLQTSALPLGYRAQFAEEERNLIPSWQSQRQGEFNGCSGQSPSLRLTPAERAVPCLCHAAHFRHWWP